MKMTNRQRDRFNEGSIFKGQEPWRKEQGHEAGMKADLRAVVPSTQHSNHTPLYVEGFLEGRDAKKRQMMEDLIMGKYDDDETEDIKNQLGLPPILQP